MMRSLYRSMLRLHPPGFRQQFAEEMLWIYDETAGAGAISLLADGFFSLVRQWLTLPGTLTLAAAGLGGAMQMALFLVMTLPMMSRSPAVIYVRRADIRRTVCPMCRRSDSAATGSAPCALRDLRDQWS